MQRAPLFAKLQAQPHFDVAVVGGGATGLGVALDAAARGFSVLLVESHDFAKGTSSRATKLVHGGVRYLAQGNIALVREALHERSTLLRNAPHLAQPLPFVMPSYRLWDTPFYGIGLKIYDALAGKAGLGQTEFLSASATLGLLSGLQPRGLKGGVKYWDGQFDDARLALALARTAAAQSALLINYCAATALTHTEGKLTGLICQDQKSGQRYTVQAKAIVNATGVWVDALRCQDGEAIGRSAVPVVAPSQGVHLVVERDFMPSAPIPHAMMIPKTADGRVLFAVPWLGKTILGTTDTPRGDLAREPQAFESEIDFILNESARYLVRPPTRRDVRSIWVGLRPLVKPLQEEGGDTKALSREHTVLVSRSGLVTVTGGKWTTYRSMAEDVLRKCFAAKLLPERAGGITHQLPLFGASVASTPICDAPGLHLYGSESSNVQALPGAQTLLGGGLSEAMVRYAVRCEYARTVEDVLARRSRLLFLDARLANSLADAVGTIVQEETGRDPQVQAFKDLADRYTLPG